MKGEKLENVLTPISLTGLVIPWSKEIGGRKSDYKLVSSSGLEYFLVADSEWRKILSGFIWEEVKVVGLLNMANRTIIPKQVFPNGPTGETEKVINLAAWKSRELVSKLVRNINDLVLVPAAICAVMA